MHVQGTELSPRGTRVWAHLLEAVLRVKPARPRALRLSLPRGELDFCSGQTEVAVRCGVLRETLLSWAVSWGFGRFGGSPENATGTAEVEDDFAGSSFR